MWTAKTLTRLFGEAVSQARLENLRFFGHPDPDAVWLQNWKRCNMFELWTGDSDGLPGWKDIINPLIELCKEHGVVIYQIKEKFGGLRFYVGDAPSVVHEAIRLAELKAEVTCDVCGKPGTLRTNRPRIRTLCNEHAEI